MNDKKEELIISQIHTPCKECVFAMWKKSTQIGCKLGRIEAYRNAGIEVMEVYDDTDREFCLINGRVCLSYRTEAVMSDHPKQCWEEIVRLQTKIPYQAIVFINKEDTVTTIKASIKRLKAQDVQPNLVTFVNKQYLLYSEDPDKYTKPSTMLECLQNAEFHQFNFKNVYDETLDDRSLIDLVFDSTKNLPYPFYVSFDASFDIPQGFSKELNESVSMKMIQLGFASPVDGINGMIVNRIAHKKHAGNSFGVNIEKKIEANEDEGHKFIFKAVDICPSLKS